ncbi:MAG TPA: cysteine desulfurase family protein [Vicinamibacteria bacterium]|jgi:cysteine desulfurase
MSRTTYLDYNATTPLAPEVLEAMLPYLREDFGNPSSIHQLGRRAKGALLEARETMASFLSAAANEMVFTASGTEADNLAILGVVAAEEEEARPRRHLVTSTIEHHAVLNVVKQLEKKGHRVSYLPVDGSGRVTPSALQQALRPDTLLVSIMSANNETGVIQPVKELADASRRAGALFHTDAVQACGKIEVDVEKWGVDLLSLSAHKLYGPKGVGALYLRQGTAFKPLMRGGGQERSRRPGTENVAGIVGLAEAARRSAAMLREESARLLALRQELEAIVAREIPGSHLNGEKAERTPNTANFRFDRVDGEALMKRLDREGFAISTGAACAAGAIAPSHVLLAMGLTPQEVQGSVRVSLGRSTRMEDARAFAAALKDAVLNARATTDAVSQVRLSR